MPELEPIRRPRNRLEDEPPERPSGYGNFVQGAECASGVHVNRRVPATAGAIDLQSLTRGGGERPPGGADERRPCRGRFVLLDRRGQHGHDIRVRERTDRPRSGERIVRRWRDRLDAELDGCGARRAVGDLNVVRCRTAEPSAGALRRRCSLRTQDCRHLRRSGDRRCRRLPVSSRSGRWTRVPLTEASSRYQTERVLKLQ